MLAMLYGGFVGIALGLTGGGGSIFAVPLLLYAVGMSLRDAVTVSLAVVGLTALYGAIFQRQRVNFLPGVALGVGGIAGAPVGAWIGSRLPEFWTLVLFAGFMLIIGAKMWTDARSEDAGDSRFACRRDADGIRRLRFPCVLKLLAGGLITGVLSGTFGVGGGFLVVPALLIVTAMPIDRALATSLVCIFLISTSGFISNLLAIRHLDLRLAGLFLAGSAVGMTAGAMMKSLFSGMLLKRIFAVGVVCVAIWIVVQTLTGHGLRRKSSSSEPRAAVLERDRAHDWSSDRINEIRVSLRGVSTVSRSLSEAGWQPFVVALGNIQKKSGHVRPHMAYSP